MPEYDANDYLNSTFIKKQDLRSGGPRRLTIESVTEVDGLPGRSGQPAKKELCLSFPDGTRFGLRAATNLRRLVEAFGPKTSMWVGKELELYFSPDVVNPGGGDPGGVRIRIPEAATRAHSASVYRSELEDDDPVPFESQSVQVEPPTPSARAAKPAARVLRTQQKAVQ